VNRAEINARTAQKQSRAARNRPRPKLRKAGRPPALNPELQERLCGEIRRARTVAESCRTAGIAESSFYGWLVRGERGEAPFVEFLEVVRRAKAERIEALEDNVVRLGRNDWRASFELMKAYAPARFAPRVREHIEEEFRAAIDRLEAEFASAPELLWRALNAIAGQRRPPEELGANRKIEGTRQLAGVPTEMFYPGRAGEPVPLPVAVDVEPVASDGRPEGEPAAG
jgi:hypothetical protein